MYKEFFSEFYKCLVCFLSPDIYGRSILENSSFIVSGAHYNPKMRGRGFVARLSGATAELLNIWIIMCLGHDPFFTDNNGNLAVKFSPVLEKSLFISKKEEVIFNKKRAIIPSNSFAFKMFSSTLVVYHNRKRKNTYDNIKADNITILLKDGGKVYLKDGIIPYPLSIRVRNRECERIDVVLD